MTLLHHFWMILLEWMQFGSFFYFIGKLIATSLLSLLLILITDLFPEQECETALSMLTFVA